jgi:hypothetical protein
MKRGFLVTSAILLGALLGACGLLDSDPEPTVEPPPVSTPTPDPQPGPGPTTLRDTPPVPLPDRQGAMQFANYSQHDMDPRCTVTDVSARIISASGVIEVTEDGVGTNNLHVLVTYEVDREMARVEITWVVDHPAGVECTLPGGRG